MPDHAVHRRADLVAHVGQELGLQPRRLERLVAGDHELLLRAPALDELAEVAGDRPASSLSNSASCAWAASSASSIAPRQRPSVRIGTRDDRAEVLLQELRALRGARPALTSATHTGARARPRLADQPSPRSNVLRSPPTPRIASSISSSAAHIACIRSTPRSSSQTVTDAPVERRRRRRARGPPPRSRRSWPPPARGSRRARLRCGARARTRSETSRKTNVAPSISSPSRTGSRCSRPAPRCRPGG